MLPIERATLFWLVCVPVRLFLATRGNNMLIRALGLLIGTRWVLGLETGEVGALGGRVWWGEERRLHGFLWLGYAVTGNDTWIRADLAVGILNWLITS